ncbi:MAG: hypothetical protein LBL57_02725, partial [Tannerella sp.]|nr:hypothetical protein [Tannerella sp.]
IMNKTQHNGSHFSRQRLRKADAKIVKISIPATFKVRFSAIRRLFFHLPDNCFFPINRLTIIPVIDATG